MPAVSSVGSVCGLDFVGGSPGFCVRVGARILAVLLGILDWLWGFWGLVLLL